LARRGDGIYVRVTPTLLNGLLVVRCHHLVLVVRAVADETAEASIMHWLIFTVICPTIPA